MVERLSKHGPEIKPQYRQRSDKGSEDRRGAARVPVRSQLRPMVGCDCSQLGKGGGWREIGCGKGTGLGLCFQTEGDMWEGENQNRFILSEKLSTS